MDSKVKNSVYFSSHVKPQVSPRKYVWSQKLKRVKPSQHERFNPVRAYQRARLGPLSALLVRLCLQLGCSCKVAREERSSDFAFGEKSQNRDTVF